MNKRRMGFVLWLLLAACLYFFENNTGTRVILVCSLVLPFFPFFRAAFFSAHVPPRGAQTTETVTALSFADRGAEEPGEVRQYQPGDPLNRMHWKLSAKQDELLVRKEGMQQESQEKEATTFRLSDQEMRRRRKRWIPLASLVLCLMLLFLVPEANRSWQALCNRLFAASERVNAYVYEYFEVPGQQSIVCAVTLLTLAFASLVSLMLLLRSRLMALGIMAGCTLAQVYFGLSFPAWMHLLVYGSLAVWMVERPVSRRQVLRGWIAILLVAWTVALFFPGVDEATERASEMIRDRLSQLTQQVADGQREEMEGEKETRRAHTQSLATGDHPAQTDRQYRLLTVEKEHISMPRWIDYLKIVLLLLLTAALVAVPFAPFLILNARRRKAQAIRQVFASPHVSEAVCAIFQQVIAWLNETGHGLGNRLYGQWAEALPEEMPKGYSLRFMQCAKDFEEAAYSAHALEEEKRQRALALLKETETVLWRKSNWKQRFRLKYWVCLWE